MPASFSSLENPGNLRHPLGHSYFLKEVTQGPHHLESGGRRKPGPEFRICE